VIKSEITKILLLILIAFLLLGAVSFLVWMTLMKTNEHPSAADGSMSLTADEQLERTVETADLTTNLYSKGYAQLKFQILTTSPKTKAELEKRMFQVRSHILQIVASKNKEDLRGTEGIAQLEQEIEVRINGILHNGQVQQVFTTKKLLQ
jgi:flagellar FliL protein